MEITLKQVPLADLAALASGGVPEGSRVSALPGALPPSFVAERALRHIADGKPAHWCSTFYVEDAAGQILGGCGFKDVPEGGEVEIGYAVAAAARSNGVGTAAVRQLLRLASEDQAVSTVVANISPANLASQRLVRSLGFTAANTFTDAFGEVLMRWCWAAAPNNSFKPNPESSEAKAMTHG